MARLSRLKESTTNGAPSVVDDSLLFYFRQIMSDRDFAFLQHPKNKIQKTISNNFKRKISDCTLNWWVLINSLYYKQELILVMKLEPLGTKKCRKFFVFFRMSCRTFHADPFLINNFSGNFFFIWHFCCFSSKPRHLSRNNLSSFFKLNQCFHSFVFAKR